MFPGRAAMVLRTARHLQTLLQQQPRRQVTLGAMRLKWISAEEAKLSHEIPVGSMGGNPQDPERNTYDAPYHGSPEKGDPYIPAWYYRSTPTHEPYIDRMMTKFLTAVFWYWVLYHLYWDYYVLVGHFYMPYLWEFTDEELGIPPDNAPDPEYWGNHGKAYGTYR